MGFLWGVAAVLESEAPAPLVHGPSGCVSCAGSVLFLLFSLPKAAALHGQLTGATGRVPQTLNGMSGGLGLLPDVVLEALVSDGVLPEKGDGGGNEAQPPLPGAHPWLRELFLFLNVTTRLQSTQNRIAEEPKGPRCPGGTCGASDVCTGGQAWKFTCTSPPAAHV